MAVYTLNSVRTRPEASSQGRLYRTDDMLLWLREARDVPEELGEAFIGSWVGLLRQGILRRAQARGKLSQLSGGRLVTFINENLGPVDIPSEAVLQQFGGELGLPEENVEYLLGSLRDKLGTLAREEMAFEPVGWFVLHDSDRKSLASFFLRGAFARVEFWADFLSPEIEVPSTMIEDNGDEQAAAAAEDAYA